MRGAPDSIADRISRDGYAVLEDAFDPELAARALDEVDRLVVELGIGPGTNGFEGRATVRVYNLLARHAVFDEIAVHPNVLPVVERVLDDGCLMSSASSIAIGPGEIAQPLHADDQVMPLARPHAAVVCNTMWALTDFTEENGATRLVPGSHRADHNPVYGTAYDTVAAVMRRGSVLVWNGSLWHGGGANRTAERRVGLAMNYCAGWVRQQENQQLGIPLETLRSFAPRLQALCGFDTYRGLIGHIDKSTPREVLLGGSAGGMLWDRS